MSLLILVSAGGAFAQNAASGNISATSTNCFSVPSSCVWESVLPPNAGTTTISITGTFSATLLVEESNNAGQTWSTAATLSAVGTTTYSTNGFTDIRVRCSAFTSGSAAVTISTGLLQVQSVVLGGSFSAAVGRIASGTTDTISGVTDCTFQPVIYTNAGGGGVTVTLPTATILGCPAADILLVNNTSPAATVTVNATPWNILTGGGSASSAAISQNQQVRFTVDPAGGAWRGFVSPTAAPITNGVNGNAVVATGPTGLTDAGSPPTLGIITPTTYFACAKGVNGTCVYNGDGGTAATGICPDDTCSGLSKATPVRTIAGITVKVKNFVLQAQVTGQLADTANTGTDCYRPSDTLFDNLAQGYGRAIMWESDATGGGGLGLTDGYPTGLFTLQGNLTTPANVVLTGAAACGGTTASTGRGIIAARTNFRFAGLNVQYFTKIGIHCLESLCFGETDTGTNDGGSNEFMVMADRGLLKLGGVWTNGSGAAAWPSAINVTNGTLDDKTPLGCWNFTHNSNFNSEAILSNEQAHEYVDCGTYSFQGTGAYAAWQAQDRGSIQFNDGAVVTITYNAANAFGYRAALDSVIVGGTCANAFNFNCTKTALAKLAVSQGGSRIYLGGTTGFGSADADNTVDTGGKIFQNWFNGTNVYENSAASSRRIGGVKGLSGTTTLEPNFGGSCTFVAATTCAVSLASTEPDSNYFVTGLEASATIGNWWITAKTTAGFTINASASNSATVHYQIGRF